MNKKSIIWLFVIIALFLVLRLVISYQTPHLNYEAYDTLRQLENIQSTGLPLYYDESSLDGRDKIVSPAYYYFLAFFDLFLDEKTVTKVIPNILAVLLILVVYKLSLLITQDENVSLITSFFSGMIPLFWVSTINSASVYIAVILLFLLSTYYLLRANKEPKYVFRLMIVLVLLTLTHAISFVISLGFLIYLALVKIYGFRESSREPEIILFFTLLVTWLNLILYKNAFLSQQSVFVWQNLPQALLTTTYGEVSLVSTFYSVGAITLILGLIGIYQGLFEKKRKSIALFSSFGLLFSALLAFRLIEIVLGLLFISFILIILSSFAIKNFVNKTNAFKFKYATNIFLVLLICLQILTFIPTLLVAQSVALDPPSSSDIEAYNWLGELNETVIVMTSPHEASAMSYYSKQSFVLDRNFMLIPDVNSVYFDATNIYADRFLTTALTRLDKYDVNYILFSEYTQRINEELRFVDDSCITLAFDSSIGNARVYSVNCRIGDRNRED